MNVIRTGLCAFLVGMAGSSLSDGHYGFALSASLAALLIALDAICEALKPTRRDP